MNEYSKSIAEVLKECEAALEMAYSTRAADGTKCALNESDFELVVKARSSIIEYCQLRDIKL